MELDELAKYAASFFVTKTRPPETPGGKGEPFVTLKKRRPSWITEMVKRVHDNGRWFPDWSPREE